MLNIYYGRESVDKEKFILSTIKERGFDVDSPVLVLVPDQYTLEAERRAFEIMDKDAIIGLDVYSMSRLGHNILSKLGTGGISYVSAEVPASKRDTVVKKDMTVDAIAAEIVEWMKG